MGYLTDVRLAAASYSDPIGADVSPVNQRRIAMTTQNKDTIRTWVETAWNRGEVDTLDDIYAPTYNPVFLQGQPFPQNLEGLKAFIRHFRTGMPDLHFEIEDMVAEGDKVAWRLVSTGTQTGELLGVPPTGKSARVGAMIFSRFEDGKWAEDYVEWDTLGMLQQLGAIPVPEGAGA
jgi:steroid delta-isomerase-like uncharacterized protein